MAKTWVSELVLLAKVVQLLAAVSWQADAVGASGPLNSASVIIIGAGMSGITAGKCLAQKGVHDFIILEGESMIGGRMKTHSFANVTVEMGANWVEGVDGPELNPIWKLAKDLGLKSEFSDYSNVSSNIYDVGGLLPPQTGAAEWNLSDAIFAFDYNVGASLSSHKQKDISILSAQRLFGRVPETPVEMAIDYYNYDFEFAEPPRVTSLENTEPLPTFAIFGADMYFVSDQRGYKAVVQHLAAHYLRTEKDGKINDRRLKLNKVVREISYSSMGVKVKTEDGVTYTADYAILTVSLGVLQSNLIEFKPDLPAWKLASIFEFDMAIYTKIYLKFPYTFWPTGPGTEFFIYADERRGYYPIWQHLENEFPGSNLVYVTITDDESRRVEQQPDKQTLQEIMGVLRTMFKNPNLPNAESIFVPKWGQARLFRGSYSNWPIGVDKQTFHQLQWASGFLDWEAPVEKLYFGGEHTNELYNGYVHGAYFSGIDSADRVLKSMPQK